MLPLVLLLACTGPAPTTAIDRDGDGVPASRDCDDRDAAVGPDRVEVCNGRDDDCDGAIDDADDDLQAPLFFADHDGDGWGVADELAPRCAPGPGWVDRDGDCDDADPAVHPDATERCGGADDDCDGLVDADDPTLVIGPEWRFHPDADGDAWGADDDGVAACTAPTTGGPWLRDDSDCDDTDPLVNPDASEACNGLDDDCDGAIDEDASTVRWYRDADGDGLGDAADVVDACAGPPGYVRDDSDCDDTDRAVGPPLDQHPDHDGDGWGSGPPEYACDLQPGYVPYAAPDCDDADPDVHPGAYDRCFDGLDTDCDARDDDCIARDAALVEWGGDPVEALRPHGRVVRAGDLDGDGWTDLITQAEIHLVSGSRDPSAVFVLPGSARGPSGADAALAYITAEPVPTYPGHTHGVAQANGDREPDLWVDCWMCGPEVELRLLTGPLIGDRMLDDAVAVIEGGEHIFDYQDAISSSDHDGDGLDDLVIGQDSWEARGRTTLHRAPFPARQDMADAPARAVGDPGDHCGTDVWMEGDVDGDGVHDLWVACGFGDANDDPNGDEGAVMLFSAFGTHDVLPDDAEQTWFGERPDDRLGFGAQGSLRVADMNGDGAPDLVVAAQAADRSIDGVGIVYILTELPGGAESVARADTTITGQVEDNGIGQSLDAADLDADGRAELLVGARSARDVGAAYVFAGPVAGRLGTADAPVMWIGDVGADRLGYGGVFYDDVDLDGFGDAVVTSGEGVLVLSTAGLF